jgi:hypothetical protein
VSKVLDQLLTLNNTPDPKPERTMTGHIGRFSLPRTTQGTAAPSRHRIELPGDVPCFFGGFDEVYQVEISR